MKERAKMFVIGFALMIHLCAHTQSHKKHAVMANIGTVLIGNYELSYEQRLDKHMSLSLIAYYYETRKVPLRVFSYGYSFGLGFIPKFHLYGHALENSFYLAPSIKVGYLNHPPYENNPESDQGILLRIGGVFGFAHAFDCGLIIDTQVGLEHYHSFSLSKKPTQYQSEKPLLIRPTFSLALGYAF